METFIEQINEIIDQSDLGICEIVGALTVIAQRITHDAFVMADSEEWADDEIEDSILDSTPVEASADND
jgi:hypothetical protein